MNKTKCPVAGCEVMKPRTMLMCLKHWRLVEPTTQREVYTYYRNQNWPEWRRSSDRAIAHVNSLQNSGGGNPTSGTNQINLIAP